MIKYGNWTISLNCFDKEYIRKCEAIFCQGNGYMGVRAAMTEPYEEQWRGTFLAGMFDRCGEDVPEIPPCSDVTSAHILLSGQPLDLNTGGVSDYRFQLDLKTGKLLRTFVWTAPDGAKAAFTFERIVSLSDIHLIAARVTVQALSDCTVEIETGIEGAAQQPHFEKLRAEQRGGYLQYVERTGQSNIEFALTSISAVRVNDSVCPVIARITDYSIRHCCRVSLKAGDKLCLEKKSNIYTTRDLSSSGYPAADGFSAMERYKNIGFDALADESAEKWAAVWNVKDVCIQQDGFAQLALRFAVYHLTIMCPKHDNRMNIAAKGLSGPGYKGHAFWDTEIYMLPFFTFTDPAAARSLLESRYNGLPSAHIKAKENGYVGAMFPWEAAWIDDGETTPSWARTGLLEHHITADVAYGVYSYHMVTGDDDFMRRYGYELIFDTAKYWQSRVEYNEQLDRYEIRGVIGPDEYTEDCDNNAFTNYMAHLNLQLAQTYYDRLRRQEPELLDSLIEKLALEGMYEQWKEKSDKLYLPKENADLLVPQDDTYLTLPAVDLTPYKDGEKHFDLEPAGMQISKQADVMVLFLLLDDLFSEQVKRKNFYYYEAKCLHHSSLSLSSYCVLAADVKEDKMAYALFDKACRIDLGQNPHSSDDGIHSASLGGIWQCVVFGFLGVRLYGENLRIQPNLPENWDSVTGSIFWRGQRLDICAKKHSLTVLSSGQKTVSFLLNGQMHTFSNRIDLTY